MGGWGGTQPTQNLVDEYEMTDGLSYDVSPLYNPNQPYKNRDPRFAASIIYDGAMWNGREIELKEGGKDGMGTANDATKTGYNLRKFQIDPCFEYSRLKSAICWQVRKNAAFLTRLQDPCVYKI